MDTTRRVMLSGNLFRYLAVCVLFLFCLCGASPAGAAETACSRDLAFADEMLSLINAERKNAGLTELAEDRKLTAAAEERLNELICCFSSSTPDSANMTDLLKRHSVAFTAYNTSYGRDYTTPARAVAAFKEGGHDVIQRDGFQRAGIAAHIDGRGKAYYIIIVTIPPA